MNNNDLLSLLPRLLADDLPATIRSAPAGVTIVIPNWNHEFVLARAIRSALASVKALAKHDVPAQVLVIDDQSRDGSLTLLRQLEAIYFDEGLRVLALSRNGGVVAVRNRALLEASYRYIIFMDADNELVPENIHTFYRSIEQTQAAVVYGNIIQHGLNNQYLNLMNNESFQNHIFRENYIDTFALYDRLQIFDSGGYEENFILYGHEDWELFLHLAASGRRLVFVPVVFGIYHDMPSSRVKSVREPAHIQERQAYLDRVFDQLGIRQKQLPNTHQLRYHPDIGYI
ncbi:MAG: glycosyltransferase family 2 protein [Anaerolineae bacterium]|nr:glycosyltransferase family 2 protein [Anaerolineae bacterium]